MSSYYWLGRRFITKCCARYQGGKDLTDLVAAQDDLMTEINERFARVVETDGKRSKNEQLIDLLNELDPVASAVAPELSVRFKFFEDMAQSRRAGTDTSQVRLPWGVAAESQAGSSTASNTAEVQRASDGTIVTSQQHSAKQSPPGFSIKFGGDQITVQSPRAMVSTDQATDKAGGHGFIAEDIASMGGRSGMRTLRCVSISDFYDRGKSNLKPSMLEPQGDTSAVGPTLTIPHGHAEVAHFPPLPSTTGAANRLLTKRLATVSTAVPACSLLAGKVVNDVGVPSPREQQPSSPLVPVLPLHKMRKYGAEVKDGLPDVAHGMGGDGQKLGPVSLSHRHVHLAEGHQGEGQSLTARSNGLPTYPYRQRDVFGLATARTAAEEHTRQSGHGRSASRKTKGYSNLTAPIVEQSMASFHASIHASTRVGLHRHMSDRRTESSTGQPNAHTSFSHLRKESLLPRLTK
mmetsp:Transcript_24630/g.68548  ORF Transcript_24630/g.68548 Transcript_24630/m.68548 type:complete len:462 (-) Transcript_24630:532-1917(-)